MIEDVHKAGDFTNKELAEITCPTLLLFGDTSLYLPVGQRLVKALPNAELEVIASGHQVPIENPEAMNRALTRFFEVN